MKVERHFVGDPLVGSSNDAEKIVGHWTDKSTPVHRETHAYTVQSVRFGGTSRTSRACIRIGKEEEAMRPATWKRQNQKALLEELFSDTLPPCRKEK